jgi:23S rRNA G2445 N2-methylase RlmL
MCGSGTLAIEAALIGLNRAAGLLRNNYAFMHLNGFDGSRWDRMKEAAKGQSRNKISGRIVATDADAHAVEAAKRNAENAGVADLIEFKVCDFADTGIPAGGGVVVLNPEYGERMGAGKDLPAIYRRIGDFLKQRCRGYRGYVFTGNPALAKMVGLRTRRRVQFFNGKIECRLLEYELYEGSRKTGRDVDNGGQE